MMEGSSGEMMEDEVKEDGVMSCQRRKYMKGWNVVYKQHMQF